MAILSAEAVALLLLLPLGVGFASTSTTTSTARLVGAMEDIAPPGCTSAPTISVTADGGGATYYTCPNGGIDGVEQSALLGGAGEQLPAGVTIAPPPAGEVPLVSSSDALGTCATESPCVAGVQPGPPRLRAPYTTGDNSTIGLAKPEAGGKTSALPK
ncbi:MAG: hypothetical protein ACRDYC_12430, partial [Acidimicrobiales bacterium]